MGTDRSRWVTPILTNCFVFPVSVNAGRGAIARSPDPHLAMTSSASSLRYRAPTVVKGKRLRLTYRILYAHNPGVTRSRTLNDV